MTQKKKDRLTKGAENIATQAGFGMFDYRPPSEDDKYRVRPAVMPNKHNLNYFTPEELERYGYKGEGVKKRGRPRKMNGGMTIKDWGLEQWDKVPDAYKPGIESIAEAAYHQAGFGLVKRKRGRPRKLRGGDIFSDMKNAFDPNQNGVAQAFSPGGPAEQ